MNASAVKAGVNMYRSDIWSIIREFFGLKRYAALRQIFENSLKITSHETNN